MKIDVWKATTLVLASALALVVGRGATVSDASAEKQPHMTAALEHLQIAKRELAGAVADKAGHRVKAIALVDEAVAEVKKGIEAGNDKPRIKIEKKPESPPPPPSGGSGSSGPSTHRVENPK